MSSPTHTHTMRLRFLLTCLAVGLVGLLLWRLTPDPEPSNPTALRTADPTAMSSAEIHSLHALSQEFRQEIKRAANQPNLPPSHEWLELAKTRRTLMAKLIQTDPAKALEQALSWSEWQSLPDAIRAHVERPFSLTGRYSLLPVCSKPRDPSAATTSLLRVFRTPTEGTLRCYLPAGSPEISSKRELSLHGVRIDHLAAISPSPLAILPEADAAALAHLPIANPNPTTDFATGEPLGSSPVTALSGNQRMLFASATSAQTFANQLQQLNLEPSPSISAASRLAAMAATGSSQPTTFFLSSDPNWTTTKKRVFIIRCDFPDFPSSSFPLPNQTDYQTQLNTQISPTIQQFSYGKTWIEASVSPAILRSAQPASNYNAGADEITANLDLYDDLLAQYKVANPSFSEANYDIIAIRFASIGMTIGGGVYSGLAEIGGGNLWLQGDATLSVHVHEFGHNYGLDHANFWQRSLGSINPVDPNGTNVEYGDPFDVMGEGDAPLGSYHAEAKQRLKWLSTGEWTPVTSSGTYSVRRIDHANTSGSRGLRITRATNDHYWISYRRALDDFHLRSGAYLTWHRPGQLKTLLVDTTPESSPGQNDRHDAPIRIGRTYSDTSANIHITAIGRSGTEPNETLSVQVNIGPFPGNVAPTGQINGPSTLQTRQAAVFSAAASDANGDSPFAYDWSFGTGETFDNNASVVMMWDTPGTYEVRCVVSDLKGGTTTLTRQVTVTEPLSNWTARNNSAVGDFYALMQGTTKLVAAGAGTQKEQAFQGPLAFSSDGGSTWSSGKFTANQHAYAGIWDGTRYITVGGQYAWTNSGATAMRRSVNAYYPAIFSATDVVFSSGNATFTNNFLGPNGTQNQFFWGIAHGNGIYIVVGDNGLIMRSTNGTTWSAVNAGITGLISNVAYGNGRFVAVGRDDPYGTQKGFIYTSTDGITWTNRTNGAGFNNENFMFFWHVAFAHDRFLFSGWNVGLHYSTDGVTFTKPRPNNREFTPAMTYGNNMWFASGYDQGASDATVDLISTDGVNWAKIATPTRTSLINCAIFHNQRFVIAGDRHTLFQGTLPVTTSARNLYTWRETNFPDRDALSVPLADADGDGVSNLMEYVFDTAPLSPAPLLTGTALPQAARVTDQPLLQDRIALQFSIPSPAPGDLTFVVESATSLTGTWSRVASKTGNGPWVWEGGGTSRIITGTTVNGRTPVSVGDSQPLSSANGRFMRLKTATAQ